MGILVALLVVAALLAGFLWLTALERKRGKRIFERTRSALDHSTDETLSYLSSDTTRASVARSVRISLDHAAHEVVHGILQAVRFIERMLTRLTREIRGRRAKLADPSPKSEEVSSSVE